MKIMALEKNRRRATARRSTWLVLFLLVVNIGVLRAQFSDTALRPNPATGEEEFSGFQMTKSPTLALVYGLIPTGGQVYTEQYWKVPMFLIPIAGLTGLGVYNHTRFRQFADQTSSLTPGTSDYNLARSNRELYRDRRDLSWAIAGGVYLLSLVDAYVGAHMFDFDVSDSLSSIQIYPDPVNNGIGISARF